jgi:hypothetical protein
MPVLGGSVIGGGVVRLGPAAGPAVVALHDGLDGPGQVGHLVAQQQNLL